MMKREDETPETIGAKVLMWLQFIGAMLALIAPAVISEIIIKVVLG